MRFILTLFALFLCIVSCTKKECEGDDIFATKEFKVKQEVCVDASRKFQITKIEDSRCPIDAICVWEGNVILICSLNDNDGTSTKLDSIVVPNDGKAPKVTSIFDEFDVLVTNVSPYPGQIAQEDYIVKMTVSK